MISFFLGIIIYIIIFLLFYRFKYGLAFYMAYLILVPYLNLTLGGFSLKWNFINLLVLLASVIEFKMRTVSYKVDWRPLYPFAFYFLATLLLMPFQNGMPFSVEIDLWRAHIMATLILPFALWNQIRIDNHSIKLYRNIMISCIGIAVTYGLFLTTMPGINPYVTIVASTNGELFNSEYADAFGEGRLFGRISSVFAHPMSFGLFLGFSLIYLYANRDHFNKYIVFIFTTLIVANIILCGVRSAIGAFFIATAFFFMEGRNYKLLLAIFFLGIISYMIIRQYPNMLSYIESILVFNNKPNAVSGSSLEMRINQFWGCINEIKDCFITGKGYGWAHYYKSLYGDHPVILAFESLVYVILCNTGFIGVIVWLVMCTINVRYNLKVSRFYTVILNSLLVYFISYSCITGLYDYMQHYVLFYILILCEYLVLKKNINLDRLL